MTDPRIFTLHRDRDITGVSGTGIVADGVRWPDGTVSIRWRGERPSTVSWNSIDDAEAVHGHGGATRIVWADSADDDFAADLDAHLETTARIAVLDPAHPLVQQLRGGPAPADSTTKDCPACEAGIPHTEHCPTPETHNWGCGCPTDTARQDTAGTVPDTDRTPDPAPAGQSRTPETPQASSTGQQDMAQHAEQDTSDHEFRDLLCILLSRVRRGVQSDGEADLLAQHVEHLLRRLDQQADTLDRVEAYAHELRYQDAMGLLAALDGPAAGQVNDSSPTRAAAVHPAAEQQATTPGGADEMPVTVEALAQLLSAADVQINHGDYPTWETLTDSGTEEYRKAARYVLKRCHVTAKGGPAAGPCRQHPGVPVIGGMRGGCTA
ncbi:hypothetical protein [Streptomyces platensis]|uniref:hypothetical protein n=1 Tax=Streptomyces platensis TaxID=58346 RepID=UPI00378C6F21